MLKCSKCGFETEKTKMMTCKECGEFGTMEEAIGSSVGIKKSQIFQKVALPEKYDYQKSGELKLERYGFESDTLNDFFGGTGLVKGSISFIAAEPGTGKSTFLGQLGSLFKNKNLSILYYSGEENVFQVSDRLKRLYKGEEELLKNINVYYGENLEEFLGLVERDAPDIVVLDSIKTIYSQDKEGEKGSLSQQDYCMEKIRSIFKEKGLTCFIIGHVTKDGETAGRKTLEHLVDGVFFMEGQESRSDSFRILKALKNRYGSNDGVVVLKMKEKGFEIVENSEAFKVFVEESGEGPGGAFTAIIEGNQMFLIEIQSLLTATSYSYPSRVGEGLSKQKLDIILATVISKTKINLMTKDVFINVISPFKLKNINIDLALIASILSSFLEIDIKKYIFLGQVGLQGEIRSIPRQEEIINKLIKMGYKKENIITREKYKSIDVLIKNLFNKKK